MRVCVAEECDRPVRARGLCTKHYQRAYRDGIVSTERNGACRAWECDRPATAGGLCNRHYLRLRSNGTTELVPRPTLLERVQTKTITGDPATCWQWRGQHDRRGYAVQTTRTANGHMPVAVARILLGLAPGDGLVARHKCDNPPCVNPAHLISGTRQDNVDDAVERDRLDRGEQHKNSKLTDAAVREIRSTSLSPLVLARRYGVHPRTVRAVRAGRGWKHVR